LKEHNYDDYSRLIASIAWRFATTYDLDVDELISEGYIKYTDCVKLWTPEGGAKFSTFLYHHVEGHFRHLMMFENNRCTPLVPEQLTDACDMEQRVTFKNLLQSLPADAMFCAEIIINTPAEMYDWVMREKTVHKVTKQDVYRYIREIGQTVFYNEQRNHVHVRWTHKRIKLAMKAIEALL